MEDDLSSIILGELPSSPDEGIGFNELLRRLEEKGATNSPTTLSKYLKELESKQIVKREVIRAKPPRLVKLFKDPRKFQEDTLKRQLTRDFQEYIRPLPLDSILPIVEHSANFFQMLAKRAEEASAPLAEAFAGLSRDIEAFTMPFREMQEWIEKNSERIKQLNAMSQEIEEAIKAGKLDPSVRSLPFPEAIRKLQQLKAQSK